MRWHVVELEMESNYCIALLGNGKYEIKAGFFAEVEGRWACLRRMDIQGSGANSLGLAALHELAQLVMELLDVDELRIEGSTRTSGAGPGRKPAPLVFRRANRTGAETGRASG